MNKYKPASRQKEKLGDNLSSLIFSDNQAEGIICFLQILSLSLLRLSMNDQRFPLIINHIKPNNLSAK